MYICTQKNMYIICIVFIIMLIVYVYYVVVVHLLINHCTSVQWVHLICLQLKIKIKNISESRP